MDSRRSTAGRCTRRRLLAWGGMLAGAGVLGAGGGAGAGPIRVGILGGSHSHGLAKARVLLKDPSFEVVGLAEDDPGVSRRYMETGIRVVAAPELLGACRVILVESANAEHARDARRALEAGCHVHVEKPPAGTMAEMETLVRLARERRRVLQMGYMWRHHPGIRACLEAAREGWLGKVYQVRGTIDTLADAEMRAELARYRAGVFFELGCHLVDPAIRLLGRPESVSGVFVRAGADGLADQSVVVFRYAKATAVLSSAALQPRAQANRSFEVLGTRGVMRVSPIEPPRLEVDLATAAGPYPAGRSSVPMPVYERYVPEMRELAAAVTGVRPVEVSSSEDLQVHEALLRACAEAG